MPVKQAIGLIDYLAIGVIAGQQLAKRVGAITQGFNEIIVEVLTSVKTVLMTKSLIE